MGRRQQYSNQTRTHNPQRLITAETNIEKTETVTNIHHTYRACIMKETTERVKQINGDASKFPLCLTN
jgi:hypothetical protein